MSDFKIVDVKWYTGRNTIGIVLIKNFVGGHKAYIGVGLGANATTMPNL